MNRISRDEMLMDMASVVSRRGTCSRLQVGAVFSRDGRIISMGYNGAPKGMDHCEHLEWTWPYYSGQYTFKEALELGKVPQWLIDKLVITGYDFSDSPSFHTRFGTDGRIISILRGSNSSFGCTVAEHAERNAIAWAARYGLALEGCELHVTHMPCLDCARSVINAGITRVVYKEPYRLRDGVELLTAAGIDVVDWV